MQINIGSSHFYSTDSDLVDKLIALDDLKFKPLKLRAEPDAINRLNNTLEYMKCITNNRETLDKLYQMNRHFVWDSHYFTMMLCGCYLNSPELLKSKERMIDINNMLFDSIFIY